MGIWGFGDKSDFKLIIKPSENKPDLWHWLIEDGTGDIRAIPPVHGTVHGFDSPEAAEADAREVVNGLGADFKDLERIEE